LLKFETLAKPLAEKFWPIYGAGAVGYDNDSKNLLLCDRLVKTE